MHTIDTETITGKLGDYTVNFILDEYPSNPWDEWDHASSLAIHGRGDYVNAEYGDLAEDVLLAIQRGYSEAAIARWLRLQGATHIHALNRSTYNGDISIVTRDMSTEFGQWCGNVDLFVGDCTPKAEGLAFLAPSAARSEQIEGSDALVKGEAGDYIAWASGDSFGYVVEDENGVELESVWGYLGLDRERAYIMSEAQGAVEAHEQGLIEQTNVVGAGFVGVI